MKQTIFILMLVHLMTFQMFFSILPCSARDGKIETRAADQTQRRDLALSHLTHGLAWKADYVAKLNPTDDGLNLNAWVTLTNTSSTDYAHARGVAGPAGKPSPQKGNGPPGPVGNQGTA